MPAALVLGAPVPAILWESLQDSLQRSVRRLVKDVAKTIGVQEGSILDELFRSGDATIRPYLFEESDPKELECRCSYLVQHPDTPLLLEPCGQPILWSGGGSEATACPEHFRAKPPLVSPNLLSVQRLTGFCDAAEPLFVAEDGTVYDATLTVKGRYGKETKRLYLFELEA